MMKINTRLTVISAIIIAIIMISSVVTVQSFTKDLLTKETESNTEEQIDTISKVVNLYLDITKERLERISSNPEVIKALITLDKEDLQKAGDILTATQRSKVVFEGIGLHNLNGIAVSSDESSKKVIGINFSGRDYHEGVTSTGEAYVSDIFMSAATNGSVLAVASPVRDESNNMVGYLVGVVDIKILADSLEGEKGGYRIILLSRSGDLILHSEGPNGYEETIQLVNQKLKEGTTKDFFEHTSNGKPEYLGFNKYDAFTVVLDRDADVVLFALKKINNNMLITGLASGLVLIILISLTSLSISKPIKKLADNIDRITMGEFDVDLGSSNIDEIQNLLNSFNRILSSLKLAVAKGVTKKEIGLGEREKPEEIFIKTLRPTKKEENK